MKKLLKALWRGLFQTLWSNRNDKLHHNQNFVHEKQHESLSRDLRLFKHNAPEWLGHHYLYLTKYNTDQSKQWTLEMKKEWVIMLIHAKNNHTQQMTMVHENQMLITDFLEW